MSGLGFPVDRNGKPDLNGMDRHRESVEKMKEVEPSPSQKEAQKAQEAKEFLSEFFSQFKLEK